MVLLIVSFSVQNFFGLMHSNFFIFLFCSLVKGTSKTYCYVSIILPTFACRILMVPGLTSEYLIQFWVYVFVWCEKAVEFDSFPRSCPIFPTPLPEENVFSTSYTLASYVVGCSCKCGLISVLSLLFHKSSVCFVPVPHCFDYCIFVVEFEIRKHNISSFILLFQDYLAFGFFHDAMQILELLVLVLWSCSWGSHEHGQQGDPTSPSWGKSVLNIHWKDWCWSWNTNTLATWCEELTHWKRP